MIILYFIGLLTKKRFKKGSKLVSENGHNIPLRASKLSQFVPFLSERRIINGMVCIATGRLTTIHILLGKSEAIIVNGGVLETQELKKGYSGQYAVIYENDRFKKDGNPGSYTYVN